MKKKLSLFYVITILIIAALAVAMIIIANTPAPTSGPVGDPSGANTAVLEDPSAATIGDVAATATKAATGVNYVWVLLCGMLVFFFQAGFALVETGFTQAKNAAHTIAMNFMVFLIGAIGYYLVGFAFQFGASGGVASLGAGTATLNSGVAIDGFGGIIGTSGFLISGNNYDVGVFALFFFQMVFMDTTCTIPTGAMAERVKFSAVVVMSFFISMVAYPLFGNWMWGGGFLSTLGKYFGIGHGAVDFAGSSVVHGMGGMIALAGAIIIGPRIGKFRKDGKPNAFPGHHIPMAMFGTILLFFCWFAFNAGSTLNGSDFRLSVVATNTMIAGAVGGAAAMFYMWAKYGKPDPSMTCNGALAGLVAITAPCAFVNSISAFIIGAIAGVLVCVSVYFVENKLKLDDPVGAISVHGVNGAFGILSLGLFADGSYGDGLNGVAGGVTGLFYGDASQLLAQVICIGVLVIWGFGSSYLFIKLLDKTMGIRVKAEAEVEGLDIPEMGALGYPSFQMMSQVVEGYSSGVPVSPSVAVPGFQGLAVEKSK